ncbi:peroxidase 27-like [Apium graveolens]|uniref:peroxidase 27-like n=1 Tax=Apium graveolens TaxID=4045 RepID=UPI003D7A7270
MTTPKLLSVILFQLILLHSILYCTNAQSLQDGFYQKSCPSMEGIVKKITAQYISKAPSLAAPLLRMHFHDCFIRGCDGSILLDSTTKHKSEKEANPNIGMRGFQVIDAAKSAVEKQCPGVVSCADILALVARDAVYAINGPFWPVPMGRRDGRVSIQSEADNQLPSPNADIYQLISLFSSKGLNARDLAVLSGGHTIGISHCGPFTNRLYNNSGKGDTDPTMDQTYISRLKVKCKPGDSTTIVEMDPGSAKTFDNDYYTLVSQRRGLFKSDSALLNDDVTKKYVNRQVASGGSTFFADFKESMVKMGQIGVLTGSAGEIRKTCGFVN